MLRERRCRKEQKAPVSAGGNTARSATAAAVAAERESARMDVSLHCSARCRASEAMAGRQADTAAKLVTYCSVACARAKSDRAHPKVHKLPASV